MADRSAYAIKAPFADPGAAAVAIERHKTMYGGKAIAPGDRAFLFDGRAGLIGAAAVTAAAAIPPDPALDRQTPRVSVTLGPIAPARAPLGRRELAPHAGGEGPQAELHFKLYRQATDKIVGLSPVTAAWLDARFG